MRTKTFTKLMLTAMALTVSLFTNAQLRYGPVAGVNMANIGGDETSENAMKLGFHFGGLLEFNVSDNFMIAPGLIYSLKGTQDKDHSDFKSNLSYLEIPINAKYRLESGLNFFAGPYVGILLSAKATDGTNDVDIKDFLQSTDFGINVGIGFDLESGLGFSVQYGLGLANVNKEVEGATDNPSNTNAVIGVSVKYMLGGD